MKILIFSTYDQCLEKSQIRMRLSLRVRYRLDDFIIRMAYPAIDGGWV